MTDAHDESATSHVVPGASPAPKAAGAPKPDPAKVAMGHQVLMAYVLVFLVAIVMGAANAPASTLGLVAKGLGYAATVVSIIAVALLGTALRWHMAVVVIVAILMLVDPFNWVVIIVQYIQAQEILKKAGYRIGFLFARKPKA